MSKGSIRNTFVIVLFVFALFGCAKKGVKSLPPIDKSIAEEECAVLIIPNKVKVNRIDGEKRGLFRSWSSGSKAATLLVPAGEHSIIFQFSHPTDGWAAKKMNCTVTMDAGNMYMISVALDDKAGGGIFSSAFNFATSFFRDQVIGIIPFTDLLPSANPEGLTFEINETDQTAFDQYLYGSDTEAAAGNTKISIGIILLGVLIGSLWFFLIRMLSTPIYFYFTGKFKNDHLVAAAVICIASIMAGVFIINYNSSGFIHLYLLASLFVAIGLSTIDYGKSSNERGVAAIKGESIGTSGDLAGDIENIIEDLKTFKLDNDIDKAIYHFNKAIEVSPFSAVFINNRGHAYCLKQEWEKAIEDFTRCCELIPKNNLYKKNLADARAGIPNTSGLNKLNNKDYAGAIYDFTYAINIAPHNPTYIFNRGATYSELRDYEKGIADFSSAIKLDSNNAAFFYYRGMVYVCMKNVEKAFADYSEAVRLEPDNETYKKNFADLQALIPNRAVKGSPSAAVQAGAPTAAASVRATIPAPVAGILLRYTVSEGAVVQAGTTVLIVESMKMELEVKSTTAGKIHFLVPAGTQIVARQTLAEIRYA